MIKRSPILAFFLLLSVVAQGQYVRLAGSAERTALYFNIDRLWNYNLYEHSRWGGGLRLTVRDCFVAEGYVGYGVKDERFKGGLMLDVVKPALNRHIYLSGVYDLEAAASRRLQAATLTDIGGLSAFMSSRMAHVERVTAGWRQDIGRRLHLGVALRFSEEERLYNAYGLLYPESYQSLYSYVESVVDIRLNQRLLLQLILGSTEEPVNCEGMSYIRLLAQYSNTFNFKPFCLHFFAQGGWSDGFDHAVPYSRMFDLGGTWGSPVYFRNSLLTAYPNEFTANAFALVSLRLQTQKPLYKIYNSFYNVGSNPVPFVGLNAAWGALWGMNADGQLVWQQLPLQAPHMGVFEPLVGVDGVIRWGMVDYGVSAAYRLTPSQAPYFRSATLDNLTLLLTATIIL